MSDERGELVASEQPNQLMALELNDARANFLARDLSCAQHMVVSARVSEPADRGERGCQARRRNFRVAFAWLSSTPFPPIEFRQLALFATAKAVSLLLC